ncbi:MAG: hypothetical protein E7621_06410 [Ruminococcaceae bacterium]|nr:hypothetical protein [Oscillospiraceae bacterium]
MKKIFALLLMVVMSVTLLAGCSDPVYDDLENFLNVEMKEVNEEYTKLTEEVGKWEAFEDDADIKKSIDSVLLPLVNSSLEKLKSITPETEEVKAIKDKYVKVMDAYKTGFEALSEGCETQEEATINAGSQKLEEAVELLDEYNKALEELAKEHGSEVEY